MVGFVMTMITGNSEVLFSTIQEDAEWLSMCDGQGVENLDHAYEIVIRSLSDKTRKSGKWLTVVYWCESDDVVNQRVIHRSIMLHSDSIIVRGPNTALFIKTRSQ
jgi:hypothetical protein